MVQRRSDREGNWIVPPSIGVEGNEVGVGGVENHREAGSNPGVAKTGAAPPYGRGSSRLEDEGQPIASAIAPGVAQEELKRRAKSEVRGKADRQKGAARLVG